MLVRDMYYWILYLNVHYVNASLLFLRRHFCRQKYLVFMHHLLGYFTKPLIKRQTFYVCFIFDAYINFSCQQAFSRLAQWCIGPVNKQSIKLRFVKAYTSRYNTVPTSPLLSCEKKLLLPNCLVNYINRSNL